MRLSAWTLEGELALSTRLRRAAFALTMLIVVVCGVLFLLPLAEFPAIQRKANQDAARVVGEVLSVEIRNHLVAVRRLSRSPLVGTALTDTAGREAYLKPFLKSLDEEPGATPILLLDYRARSVAGGLPVGVDVESVRRHAAAAMERRQPWLSVDRGEGRPFLIAVYPIAAPYSPDSIGALVGAIDLSTLLAKVHSGLGENLEADLIDRGTVIAAHPVQSAASYFPGRYQLALGMPIDEGNLTLGVHSTDNPWVSMVLRQFAIATVVAVMLGALFWQVAKVFARRLTQRLDRLSEHCRAISEGREKTIPEDLANDEIGILSRTLRGALGAYEEINANLEGLVAERTRVLSESESELRRAKVEADAANVAKSQFLANISHEIRTPLNAVIGLAHLIRKDGVNRQQAERLDRLQGAAEHLLELLNAVLDLSKIEAGKFTIEQIPLRVEAVVANVLSMVDERARAKGLSLTSRIDPMPANLAGDPTRLQQALLNYVNNAIKFTEEGSVAIRARLLDEDAAAMTVRFEVEDTGIGIDAVVLRRLFSAFEQADSSTTRRSGGTGLGLAITRRLAELMGGEAGARSTPGQGSVFWFTARLAKQSGVPAGSEPGDDVDDAGAALQREFAGTRLLVVEDDPVNREVAAANLQHAGLLVELARDGEEAVQMALANDYRLILMDMQMPRMNGLDATRHIRSARPDGTPTIIAMTANAFAEDRARCFDAGMDDFIAKPVNPEDLYRLLLRWLRKTATVGPAPRASG